MQLQISKIKVGDRFRKLNNSKVEELANSIKTNGLIHSIVVDTDYRLVAGYHRLEAYKLLGLKEIDAVIKESEPLMLRLMEIDENLVRNELTVLEIGEHALERDRILTELGLRAKRGENRHTISRGEPGSPLETTEKIAKSIGVNERSLQKYKQAATNINDTVKDAIRKTPIANATKTLLAIARMDDSEQRQVATVLETNPKIKGREFIKAVREAARTETEESVSIVLEDKPNKVKTLVQMGDIWHLGRHTLTCGDSSIWRPREHAKMAFADPPYGVDVAEWDKDFYWQHDWIQEFADYVMVTPGTSNIAEMLRLTSMNYRWLLTCGLPGVYGRHSAVGTSNTINTLLFSDLPSIHCKANDFYSNDYFECNFSGKGSQDQESKHPGRKPVRMLDWLIKSFTSANDIVLDPFLGSGTTLLVCESLNRICHGCEIKPEYCAEIIERWETQTGQVAKKA